MYAKVIGDAGEQVGRPCVVYIPGLDGTGEFLLGTAQRLQERFRLVRMAYETDGKPGGQTTYAELADSIRERLQELGVQQGLVLAESFGGGVALELALRHPDWVRGMMLINTFCHFPQRIRIRLGLPWPRLHLQRSSGSATANWRGKAFSIPGKTPMPRPGFGKSYPHSPKGATPSACAPYPHWTCDHAWLKSAFPAISTQAVTTWSYPPRKPCRYCTRACRTRSSPSCPGRITSSCHWPKNRGPIAWKPSLSAANRGDSDSIMGGTRSLGNRPQADTPPPRRFCSMWDSRDPY